jgi:hypothetical protein
MVALVPPPPTTNRSVKPLVNYIEELFIFIDRLQQLWSLYRRRHHHHHHRYHHFRLLVLIINFDECEWLCSTYNSTTVTVRHHRTTAADDQAPADLWMSTIRSSYSIAGLQMTVV